MSERVAIYCRVSTAGQQEEGTSLRTQEAACREYAAERGWEVVGTFVDVHSGFDLHERPGMARLRALVAAGAVDAVVTYAVDRLTRNQMHLGVLLDEAERHDVRLEAVSEPLDQSAMGQFILAARAFTAEVEREKIRERSMRGKNARLAEGRLPTWTCDLYGYRTDRERAVRIVREDEAEVVRFIFGAVVEGVSLHEICRQLNERGVPSPGVERMTYRTPKTPRWHASSIHHTIANPAYRGLSVANRFTRVKFRNPDTGKVNKRREVTKPEEDWTVLPEGLTPALVDAGVWERANERLRVNRGTYNKNKRRPYLLRGLMRCAACGGAMYSERETGTNQRRTYRCSNGKRGRCAARSRAIAEEIEAWVWGEVLGILRNREAVVAELRRRWVGAPGLSPDAERSLLTRQIAALEERQGRLLRRFSEQESTVPWSLVETEIGRLEEEKAGLQARLSEAEAANAAHERQTVRVGAVAALIDELAGTDLEGAGFDDRARTIRDLGLSVLVGREVWTLEWSLPVAAGTEDGLHIAADFSDVAEPTAADREADAAFQTEEGVRRGVQAFTSASISFGSA
jgi:DNA invertase Pin-like site-specific DNA recombinase